MISALMPAARSDSRKAAALPTSSMVTLRRIGALAAKAGQQLAEVLDARRRQRLDRAGRDAVDAHALGPRLAAR
jgi:hypothetical protein